MNQVISIKPDPHSLRRQICITIEPHKGESGPEFDQRLERISFDLLAAYGPEGYQPNTLIVFNAGYYLRLHMQSDDRQRLHDDFRAGKARCTYTIFDTPGQPRLFSLDLSSVARIS